MEYRHVQEDPKEASSASLTTENESTIYQFNFLQVTKSSILSLAFMVKSSLFILSILGITANGYSQQTELHLTSGEQVRIEASSLNGLNITGNGSALLYSNSGGIHLHGDITVSNGVNLVSKETIQLRGDGTIHIEKVNADLYVEGSWSLNTSLTLSEGKEFHSHNAKINLNKSNLYVDDLLMTGENHLYSNGGIVLANKSLMASESLEAAEEIIYAPENIDQINDSDVPIHFFSVVANTCGTDPGQTPLTIDTQVITNFNGESISCNGADDAEVEVTVVGGIGPFAYEWFPSSPNNSNSTFSGLGAGTYSVLVTDSGQVLTNGQFLRCIDNIQVAEPAPLAVFSLNLSEPSCAGVCDGSSFPIVLGGTGSYTFEYAETGGTNQVALDLCEGSNTLTIRDVNLCGLDTTFVIELDAIVLDLVHTERLCFGDPAGTASVNPSGGEGGPYDVVWSTTDIGNSVTGLTGGSYTVTVTDISGCPRDSTFTIPNIPEIVITFDSSAAPVCADDDDGTINVSISGGAPLYTTEWTKDGIPFSVDEDLSNLEVGFYELTVTDDALCTQTFSYDLESDEKIQIDSVVDQISCFGVCDGRIALTITQAQEPLTIAWTGPGGFTSNQLIISDLCAGTYDLLVDDAVGCSYTRSFDLDEPTEITVSETLTNVSCNGSSDGSIRLDITNGVVPFTLNFPFTQLSATSLLIDNLNAGIYNVELRDNNNCLVSASYEITEDEAINIVPDPTDPLCSGESTGSIDLVLTGGTDPLTVAWTGPGGFTSDQTTIAGLSAGDYTVIVTDASAPISCTESIVVTLTDPTVITVDESITHVLCNGDSTGDISLEVNDALDPLTAVWTPDLGNTLSPSGLPAGTYDVIITDGNGCQFSSSYDITEPSAININEAITQPTCVAPVGAISIALSGGIPLYTIAWTGPGGFTSDQASISNLADGTYAVNITDDNNCLVTESYDIITEEDITITPTIVQPGCLGITGDIDILVEGGTSAYIIAWTGPGGFSSDQTSIIGLAPGDYTVIVTDANENSCVEIETYTITPPGVLDVFADITHILCFGTNTGAIDLTVTGGAAPLTVIWTGGVPAPAQLDQTGLVPGTYTVQVTDNDGCSFSDTYIVNQNNEIVITANVTQPGCAGTLGAINITDIANDTEPTTVAWIGPGAFNSDQLSINGLAAGDYTVTSTDANNCTSSETYTITSPGVLDVSADITHILCNDASTGAIELTAAGAADPVTAVWTPNQGNTMNPIGLSAGTYDVVVTDVGGCSFSGSFEVLEETAIDIAETIVQPTCSGDLGSISVVSSGGNAPYTISWSGPSGFASDQGLITNIIAGTYVLTVTDANNCIATESYDVNEQQDVTITADVIQPGCAGTLGSITITDIVNDTEPTTVVWTGPGVNGSDQLSISGLTAGDYTVTVTDANNCGASETYTITAPGVLDVAADITHVLCDGASTGAIQLTLTGATNPTTAVWTPDQGNTLNPIGLSAGIYDVVVTDAVGCSFSDTYEVLEETAIDIAEDIIQPTCAGDLGSITIVNTGGVEPYTITWTGIVAPNQTTITDLIEGTYSVDVTDANGCIATESYDITTVSTIAITADVTQPGCVGTLGTIEITDIANDIEPTTITWTGPGGFTSDQMLINGLVEGDYNLTVRDVNNCTASESYTIDPPGVLNVSENVTNVDCNGGSTGSILLTVIDGVDPLTVTWIPALLGNSLTQTDLSAGTYEVSIQDAVGCQFNAIYDIVDPDLIDVSETITQAQCSGDLGSISIVNGGGTGAYTVSWTGPGGFVSDQEAITDLSAGTYTAEVTDENNCMVSESYDLIDPVAILVTADITQPGCLGTLGSIEITSIINGTGPYVISWTGPAGFTSDQMIITNLVDGDYILEVTDATNCMVSSTYTITPPGVLSVVEDITGVSCNGESTGSIVLTVSGAVEPLTVTWVPASLGTSLIQSGLSAATYDVTIVDADGCDFSGSYEIIEPEVIDISETIIQPTCSDDLGEITILNSGGTGTYFISWVGITAPNQTTVNGLSPGIYTAIVTDENNCSASEDYEIIGQPAIAIDVDITQPGCAGTFGTIEITSITDGTDPYTLAWSGPGGFSSDQMTIVNLLEGDYTLDITDANSCTVSEIYTITPPGVMDVSADITHVDCSGQSTGAITLTTTGATEPLTVTWVPAALGSTLSPSGLSVGSYTVSIVDVNGCQFDGTYEITETDPIIIEETITQPVCGDDLGEIAVAITSGGTAPYIIAWSGPGGFSSNQPIISNLASGIYDVLVTDVNGCNQTASYEIIGQALIDIAETVISPGCTGAITGSIDIVITGGVAPYTVIWTGVNAPNQTFVDNLDPGNYSVLVTDANGCTAQEDYIILPPGVLSVSPEITHNSCFGLNEGTIILTVAGAADPLNVTWVPASLGTNLTQLGLASGVYEVTIVDGDGCSYNETYVINEPTQLEITETISPILCADDLGTISLEITGGTEPYLIVWTGAVPMSNSDVQTDLPLGNYSVTVTDVEGCSLTEDYVLSGPAAIEIVETVTQPLCFGELGAVSVSITGGIGNYTISWSGPGGFTSDQLSITALAAGMYTISVTDENGCLVEETYEINLVEELTVNLNLTQPECFTLEGTAELNISGGTEPYGIVWTGLAGADDQTLVENIAPGDYSVTVTAGATCPTYTEDFTITEPYSISVDASIEHVLCNAENTGAIDITLQNTTGITTVLWTNTATGFSSPTEDIENLLAGMYDLQVTDEIGCLATEAYEVTETEAIVITLVNLTDESCGGLEDGQIDIDITGGTEPYTVSWISLGGFTSDQTDLSSLAADVYSLQVIDANDCLAIETYTIAAGAEMTINVTTVNSICGSAVGSASADITSDNAVATISWFDPADQLISNDPSISNVASGIYSIQVTDVQGCSFTENFTISDSDATLMDIVVTGVSCFGDTDGSIDITASGGTEPYLLTWGGPVAIADNEFNPTNLPAGEYAASISDAGGCNSFELIEVIMPDTLVINETITNVSCNGENDGEISISILGGTGPYTILWTDSGNDTDQRSNLTPGDYTVVLTDANDCTATETYTISEDTILDLQVAYDDLLCPGALGTDVDVTISGGVEPYTFAWTGDINSANEDLVSVGVGSYTITVTDAAGCTIAESITITENPEIIIDVTKELPSCQLDDGSMSVIASGGSGVGYQYFWYNTTVSSTLIGQDDNVQDLEAGTYFLEVFDSEGCFSDLSISLSNNQGSISAEITDIPCANDPTGAIDITVSDLTEPLTFSWSGVNGFTSGQEDISALEAGDYIITVTDVDGCQLIETYTVASTTLLEVDIEIDNVCFGETGTGTISIEVNGGIEPYTVSWTGNGIVSDQLSISDLDIGCYILLVTDANNCSFGSEVCVNSLNEIVLETTETANLCFNDGSGQIDLTVSGGDPDYIIQWTDENGGAVADQEDLTDLNTGIYTALVTDMSGCEATTSSTVASNPEIVVELEIAPIACPGDENGEISISYSGGVGTLELTWTGPDSFTSTSDLISNLDDGDYCYEITDVFGCVASDCVDLSDPDTLNLGATVTDIACAGLSNGEISLEVTGGYSPYTQQWVYNTAPFSNDEDLTALEQGNYAVTLTDSMGCVIQDSFDVTEPTPLEVNFDNIIGSTCETSFDGSFEITVTGGIQDYAFEWSSNGDVVSNDEDPTELTSGSYSLEITDANSCVLDVSSIFLSALGNVQVDVPETIEWCFTETDQLIVANSFIAQSVYWQNEAEEVISTTDSVYFSADPGIYELVFIGEDGPCVVSDTTTVTIYELPIADAGEDGEGYIDFDVIIGGNPTSDSENTIVWTNGGELLNDSLASNPTYLVVNEEQLFVVTVTAPNGCTSVDSMYVYLAPEIDVHTGLTPNGDGINDTWVLGNHQNYPSIQVWIYNRWGDQIFYSAGYTEGWDGTFKGKDLPIGTYYYIIDINEPEIKLTFDGPVTILR